MWRRRRSSTGWHGKAGLDADPALVAFFESPAGLAFLRRLVLAAVFQFCQVCPCGVDHVGAFLRLTGLNAFVAASHAVLRAVADAMEGEIVDFGAAQRPSLAAKMPRRQTALCQDETFHPAVCLVAIEKAEAATTAWREHRDDYFSQARGPGRAPLFDKHIAQAQAVQDEARAAYGQAVDRCDAAEAAIRNLSRAYHPVDLTTTALRDANVVIAFFHANLARRLAALPVDNAIREHIRTQLIPALYLLRVAGQAPTAAERENLRATGNRLLLGARTGLDGLLDPLRGDIEQIVRECVNAFVRATSCVEGRNGQLALRHHSLHRLPDRRLTTLTVIHNFHIRRPDDTTDARRFFGAAHDDLFERVLDHLEAPARPRIRLALKAA